MVDNARNNSREAVLVRQAVEGDVEAFGSLYDLYRDAIYRFIYYRIDSAVVAEDLTEIVFLKAWIAIAGFGEERHSFAWWLYRIARNVVIDYHRTRKEDLPLRSELLILTEDQDAGPEEVMLGREEVKELEHAISRLPDEQRQVIVLRFAEGLSHAEISEITGKSEEACRVIQHRALAALNRLLGGER